MTTTAGKADHSFTNYVSDNNATCTADGTKTAKCDNCDAENTITDAGSKVAHSLTNYVSNNNATCTADGTKTAKCDNCDATDTITDAGSKVAHSFTNYVSNNDATCTADGTKTAKCTRCDETDTVTDVDSKLGHTPGAAATCTTAQKCTVCNAELAAALGHNTDGTIAHKDATCTEAGVVGGKYCTVCNNGKAAAEAIIEAKGHTYGAWIQTAAPDCDHKGSERRDCVDCDHFETQVIAALGHNFGALIEEADAVHTQTELKPAIIVKHYHCERCDGYFNESGDRITEGYSVCYGPTPVHTFELKKVDENTHGLVCECGKIKEGSQVAHTVGTAATCRTQATCAVCEQYYGAMNPDNHVAGPEATEETAQVCILCNKELVAAFGHVHGVKVQRIRGKSATETEAGWNEYYQCSCGNYYEDKECTKQIVDLEEWKVNDGKLIPLGEVVFTPDEFEGEVDDIFDTITSTVSPIVIVKQITRLVTAVIGLITNLLG